MKLTTFDDLPDLPDDEEPKPQGPRPYLEDTRSLKQYIVPIYPMFIGREKKGSVCIPVPAVSRRHAKVFEREGSFYIQDDGSLNGTFVNDKRIIDPAEIVEGDRIIIGKNKEYPRGVREYVFKYDISEEEREAERVREEEARKRAEGQQLLEDAGISKTEDKKILLRHCTFHISKKDFMSVLTSDQPRRVPIEKIDLKNGTLEFLSLTPYRVKENVTLTIKHPRLSSPLVIFLRIAEVTDYPHYNISLNKATIVRTADTAKQILDDRMELNPLICYVTCKLKE